MASVLTPKARLSFPALDKPRANKLNPNNPPRYEATLLIPKTPGCTRPQDDPALKALVADLCRARDVKFPNAASRPKGLHNPILDGDQADASWEDLDGYAGHWFIRTWNKNLPTYRDQYRRRVARDDIEKAEFARKNEPLCDKYVTEQFYAGCYVYGAVSCFYFENTSKKGFSFSLNGLMFAGDGDPFGAGDNDSDDAFAAVKAEDKPVETAAKGDDYF